MASDGSERICDCEVTKEIRSPLGGHERSRTALPRRGRLRILMSECGALSVLVLSKKNDVTVIPSRAVVQRAPGVSGRTVTGAGQPSHRAWVLAAPWFTGPCCPPGTGRVSLRKKGIAMCQILASRRAGSSPGRVGRTFLFCLAERPETAACSADIAAIVCYRYHTRLRFVVVVPGRLQRGRVPR